VWAHRGGLDAAHATDADVRSPEGPKGRRVGSTQAGGGPAPENCTTGTETRAASARAAPAPVAKPGPPGLKNHGFGSFISRWKGYPGKWPTG